MYRPKYTDHNHPELLGDFMTTYSFATVITHDPAPYANHLPLLFDPGDPGDPRAPHGRLVGHMARANPQWRHLESGQSALVLFHGPHAYISPSLYVTQPNVPTWNYAVVHACGKAQVFHDEPRLEKILQRTVEKFERERTPAWKYEIPEAYRRQLIASIVGFQIEIESLEGKFKLSQNRLPEDRAAVATAFADDPEMSELMRKTKTSTP